MEGGKRWRMARVSLRQSASVRVTESASVRVRPRQSASVRVTESAPVRVSPRQFASVRVSPRLSASVRVNVGQSAPWGWPRSRWPAVTVTR